jgi:HlyD family secretion protein
MKLTRQRMLLLGLLLALGAGLVYAFMPRPVPVDVAPVTRGALQVTVNEDGRTRIKERYIVSAPLGGRLHRVELHPGDVVEAGKTLLTAIEPTDPELLDPRARAQAEARVRATETSRQQAIPLLERARTAWEFAQTDLERAKRLYQEKTLSHQELDNAEQKERTTAEELKAAQFAVQIADYELELARAALLRAQPGGSKGSDSWQFPIVSPITGRVLRVFQESSTVVPTGARLIELGDPGVLEVEIDVLSADAVKIKPGAKVLLEHWGGDAPLPGRVRVVEPSGFLKISALGVEEQRVNVIVDFTEPFEKRAALGDAYRVEARIVIWESGEVLKVPVGALFREGDDWAVFVVAEGRAKLQPVIVGQRNDLEAEIKQNLAAGSRVIVHPSDKVQNGGSVKVR